MGIDEELARARQRFERQHTEAEARAQFGAHLRAAMRMVADLTARRESAITAREVGELLATVKGVLDSVAQLERASRDGFRDNQQSLKELEKRIESVEDTLSRRITTLEQYRYLLAGIAAAVGALVSWGLINLKALRVP